MIEKKCNLWNESAAIRCILTNGAIDGEGLATLSDPIAREADQRFAGIAIDLGRLIASRGNHVHEIRPGLYSFPVQQFLWSGPSVDIIQRSKRQLIAKVGDQKTLLPRPGCGPGELTWDVVSAALADLPDNIIVIEHI